MIVFKFIKGHKWLFLTTIMACLIIIVIRFTTWRPFGYSSKAESVNYTLETISYSVMAAIIFWVVNDLSSYSVRKKIAAKHIDRHIWTINVLIRQMIDAIEPFSLTQKRYSLDSFKHAFNSKDLYDGFYGGSRRIVDVYTEYKKRIEVIAEDLLASYSEYMTYQQLKYLDDLLNSFLIRHTICPKDFSIPEEERYFFPSNQEEVGESLYLISKMRWPE